MNKKYFIIFICVIIFLIVIFTSVAILSNTNPNSEKDKITEEINYMETKIIGMLNSLNNIPFSSSALLEQNSIKGQKNSNNDSNSESQNEITQNSQLSNSTSDSSESETSKNTDYTKYNVEFQNILISSNQEIDWDYLKNSVSVLFESWPTIMLDLHSINIKNEDILTFSNNLDLLIVNIEKQDKKATLNSLAILYSYLPVYLEQYSDDIQKINIENTKSKIINAYVLLEEETWDKMQSEIAKAEEHFRKVINSIEQDSQGIDISKTYLLINEINNAINLKDKKLFYLKYKNVMESILSI